MSRPKIEFYAIITCGNDIVDKVSNLLQGFDTLVPPEHQGYRIYKGLYWSGPISLSHGSYQTCMIALQDLDELHLLKLLAGDYIHEVIDMDPKTWPKNVGVNDKLIVFFKENIVENQ